MAGLCPACCERWRAREAHGRRTGIWQLKKGAGFSSRGGARIAYEVFPGDKWTCGWRGGGKRGFDVDRRAEIDNLGWGCNGGALGSDGLVGSPYPYLGSFDHIFVGLRVAEGKNVVELSLLNPLSGLAGWWW
jgi:hypothetical protein